MSTQTGAIVWEGASQLDGSPIVCIATWGSKNPKTGDAIQTWILRADMVPAEASHTGADSAICGKCPLRGLIEEGRLTGRRCYVNLGFAPRVVFLKYKRGGYERLTAETATKYCAGKMLRLGAYGDPVAIPRDAWDLLLDSCASHAGYTHQWGTRKFDAYRTLLMASCENVKQAAIAQARGWRTFRTGKTGVKGEILCPASAEAGKLKTCAECGLCDGASRKAKSVYIPAHGGRSIMGNWERANA